MIRLVYKPITGGDKGFAPWLAKLRNVSGVYVIRRPRGFFFGPSVLYVGESHTGRLAKTIARHFQSWTGEKAGPTYDRQEVEVAVITCPPSAAYKCQMRLIQRLRPRDNVIGVEGPVPF